MMTLYNVLNGLPARKGYKACRKSSFDNTGGNIDAWQFEPCQTKILADIDGPGVISHIWFTVNSPDPLYGRKLVLEVFWDGEENPSICCPLGDFFGLGHCRSFSYQCAAFSTSSAENGRVGGGVAMNCWLPMPFAGHARIQIRNEQEQPVHMFYFYIDYQKLESIDSDLLYLHAQWRRENPCGGWSGDGSVWGSQSWEERHRGPEDKNLSDENNYLILDAEGTGHYIGVNMSIDHTSKGWWGEGDDMIFVDRDGERAWPPDLHGTGSEDYLCQAWGMQKNVAHMYSGMPFCEDIPDFNEWGKCCVYRYHIVDPIPFTRSIRVSIEHGHANDRSDDFSSVAYWYQTEPHKVFAPIIRVNHRIPNP